MSATIQLTYNFSDSKNVPIGGGVTGTATGYYVYAGWDGQKTSYRLDSVSGITANGGGKYKIPVILSSSKTATLPADFHTAISVTGCTSYITAGKTASGTIISYTEGSNLLDFINQVGPGGTITCVTSETQTVEGSWSGTVSDLDGNWKPDSLSVDDPEGIATEPIRSGVGCGGIYSGTEYASFSETAVLNITYLTEVEANRGRITVTPTANNFPMNTTVSANVVVSGSEASYFTIQWLLQDDTIVTDPIHYPIVDRMVSTDAYVENILRWDDNLAGVIATVYTADGEELASALANFIVVGPPAPPTVFNIEKFGVGIGQVSEGTEDNPLLTIDYNTKFTQKVTAHNGLTLSDGWHPLTLASGISEYDCGVYGPGAAYRVEGGNHVYVAAGVGNFKASKSAITIATGIPEEYRPANDILFSAVCTTTDTNVAHTVYRCAITPTGEIQARCEFSTGSSAGRTDNITALDLLCDYWLDTDNNASNEDFVIPESNGAIFNIEPHGVAVGKYAEGTETNSLFEVNMPSNFNANVTMLNADLSNGWHDLTLASGVTASTDSYGRTGGGAKYKVEGQHHVYIAMNVGFTAAMDKVLATIPAEYAPEHTVSVIGTASATGVATLIIAVNPNGDIVSECAYNQGDLSHTTSTYTYTDIYLDYFI